LTASHGSLKHSNRLCTSQPWSCLTQVAQAQQQAMYQQAWSCLTQVSSTATGYVPADYLGASIRSLKHSNRYVPAGWSCLTRVAQAGNRLCTSRLPWAASQVSSTATGYVPAGYAGHLTQVAQAQQQAMYQQATLVPSHGSLKHSNNYDTRLP
jgi:hypothetical protein